MRIQSPKPTVAETTCREEALRQKADGGPVPVRPVAIGQRAAAAMRQTGRAAMLTGLLSVALGLVRLVIPSAQIAYSAAVSFAGLGLALVAMGCGRRTAARLTAAAIGLIDLAVFIRYVTAWSPGVDTTVSRTWWPEIIDSYGINPNAALGLVLIAMAVLLSNAGRDFRWGSTGTALCGSAAAALGLNAIAGRLTGLQTTFGWERFESMAVPPAAGLVFLGVGILAISWRQSRGIPTDQNSWILVIVTMAGAVTTVSLWEALKLVAEFHLQSEVQLRTDLAGAVLILGLLATALLCAAIYMAQTARLRADLAEGLRNQAEKEAADRKLAEQELGRANAYNRSLIEASLDPLVTIAPDGKITDVNRAAEEATGFPRRALTGTAFLDYFTDAEKARRGYELVFRAGIVQDYELEIRRRDGHTTPVLYNASVYRDEGGKVAGVFAAARDITQRKRAEAALQQKMQELARSNADLEQFAYVASHDLQEPLRMVANFTQLLAKRYRGRLDNDADEFIGYAVDGARRMQTMIEDLLAYSRVGTRGKAFEPVDCNEVLGRAVANLQIAIQETGALVSHPHLPIVLGDASQLLQLFQNLISNALKFRSAEPPRIHVSATYQETGWVFAVQDNGIGISPEYADRIFVIFQRLHTREEYPGTGIGLSVCKKIVERHQGRIWVESQPGQGATFFFSIAGASETE